MDENMKNNEIIDVDYTIEEELEVTEIEPEESSGGIGKFLLGVVAVGGAIVGYRKLTKERRREKQIKKLEKEGYVIIEPSEVIEIETEPSEAIEAEE